MTSIDKSRYISRFLFLNLGHSGAISNGRLFIFGGRSSSCRLNDIYTLELKTHEWIKISSGFLPGLDSFIGTGLMSDRDGSVCDADGNFYPEGRSLHSFTRYILYTFFPLELEFIFNADRAAVDTPGFRIRIHLIRIFEKVESGSVIFSIKKLDQQKIYLRYGYRG